jgi:hypothetical protein
MTLPSGPFVCKNIDVIWWCEEHESSARLDENGTVDACWRAWVGALRGRSHMPCIMVERGLVDPGEVIPAEVDYSNPPLGEPRERYRTEWQPVVSDKE